MCKARSLAINVSAKLRSEPIGVRGLQIQQLVEDVNHDVLISLLFLRFVELRQDVVQIGGGLVAHLGNGGESQELGTLRTKSGLRMSPLLFSLVILARMWFFRLVICFFSQSAMASFWQTESVDLADFVFPHKHRDFISCSEQSVESTLSPGEYFPAIAKFDSSTDLIRLV